MALLQKREKVPVLKGLSLPDFSTSRRETAMMPLATTGGISPGGDRL